MSAGLAGLGDDQLLTRLRSAFETVDPVPGDLVAQMIAVVAAADIDEELELLMLVHDSASADAPALRGIAVVRALTFEDGAGLVLDVELGHDRVMGQVATDTDGGAPATAALVLDTDTERVDVELDESGFFTLDVPPGTRRVRFQLQGPTGRVATPWLDLPA